jgi:transposase
MDNYPARGGKDYDSEEFREALAARSIKACIPPKRNRKIHYAFDKQRYKTRQKVENMFGKLKDWRRMNNYLARGGEAVDNLKNFLSANQKHSVRVLCAFETL